MSNQGDILFYDNLRVEFYQDFFYFFPPMSVTKEEQHIKLSPENASKLAKDLSRIQKIAKCWQTLVDRETLAKSTNADVIDGRSPLQHFYGYTSALQDFSLVRLMIGTRNRKVEIWLQSFYIHHSDPCKIQPSSVKIKIDVKESYFYLDCFIRETCTANALMLD